VGGSHTITGNLFFGNTATNSGNVVYGTNRATSNGYNVSDKTEGTTANLLTSGYAANANGADLFSVTDITFATSGDPATKPSSGSNLKTLTALPEGFPTTYFNGTPRSLPATAGAVASE
jgi:hypothetical protein